MQPEERFDLWGAAHELAVMVYRATRTWPNDEPYGLAGQARRAVFTVTLHLADHSSADNHEGHRARLTYGLNRLSRLGYTLILARELGHLDAVGWEVLDRLRGRVAELVHERMASS